MLRAIPTPPDDQGLALLLIPAAVALLSSSAAWLVSRRLGGRPALRHLVLLSALCCCLAAPVLAWFCSASGLSLFTLPILVDGQDVGLETNRTDDAPAILVQPVCESRYTVTAPVESADSDAAQRIASVGCAAPPVTAAAAEQTSAPLPPTLATYCCPDGGEQAVAPEQDAAILPAQPLPPDAAVQAAQSTLHGFVASAVWVWSAGVLLLLARGVRSSWNAIRLRRTACPIRNERLRRLLQEAARQAGARRTPLLLVSSRVATPLAVGFGRPAVILPQRLLGAVGDDPLRDILVHEVAHLRRGDQWTLVLQELARALYWPIISVHALVRELQRAREDLCDNAVLAVRDAISYGETLLRVAELAVASRRSAATLGIVGARGELERRIVGLIDPDRTMTTRADRKIACLVVALFLGASALVSATRLTPASSAADAEKPVETAEPDGAAPPATVEESCPDNADAEALRRAAHYSGRVTGPDGRPVRGAQIYLAPYPAPHFQFASTLTSGGGTVLLNPLESLGPVRAETDSDGRFEFDAPEMAHTTWDGRPARRQGLLLATAEGFAPDWIDRSGRRWDPVVGENLDLRLSELGTPIRGRFLGPGGQPLTGARVELVQVMIPERRNLDAHLAEVSALDGSMIDYARELEQPGLLPDVVAETRTDIDGQFTLPGLGRDWLAILKVSDPAVVTTHLAVMTRDAPAADTRRFYHGAADGVIHGASFTLRLEPGRTISGRVVDRDTGEGLPGMWVGTAQNSRAGIWRSLYPWTTDEQGRFTITGLPDRFTDPADDVVVAIAPPGVPYQMAGRPIGESEELVIKCPRGIPFRLKVVDEQGHPVEAEVTWIDVQPNPHVEMLVPRPSGLQFRWPSAPAARRADGIYEGFAMPGPGAVLVDLPRDERYRPDHVDPKAFFAPDHGHWTTEQRWAYGTDDTLATSSEYGHVSQRDYEAIVLVNPAPRADPLELSATVFKDRPRPVHLIGPDGQPVHDVTWTPYGQAYHDHLLPLRGLHPDRVRPLTYFQEDRRLVGFLLARGDGDAPYTVRMQPWGAIVGRVVDQSGEPIRSECRLVITADHGDGVQTQQAVQTDGAGRFSISKLVPGHRYTAKVQRGEQNIRGRTVPLFAGMAFEDVVLRPGKVRDLGDVRTQPPVFEEFPLDYEE